MVLQSGSGQNELLAGIKNALYRLTFKPPQIVEWIHGIEMEFGDETVLVDPNQICIFGPHLFFNNLPDPMGPEGLNGIIKISKNMGARNPQ